MAYKYTKKQKAQNLVVFNLYSIVAIGLKSACNVLNHTCSPRGPRFPGWAAVVQSQFLSTRFCCWPELASNTSPTVLQMRCWPLASIKRGVKTKHKITRYILIILQEFFQATELEWRKTNTGVQKGKRFFLKRMFIFMAWPLAGHAWKCDWFYSLYAADFTRMKLHFPFFKPVVWWNICHSL